MCWGWQLLPANAQSGDSEKKQEQKSQEPPGIQDNSFLVEEAYNQEYGVVQHIQIVQRLWQSKDWAYSFTQEWPVDRAPRNQLSYTIPVMHGGGSTGTAATGMGDIALNYRYQVLGNGKARVAFAPRLSVLLPTGDSRRGLGSGGAGLQSNLALSVLSGKRFVTHWNLGGQWAPAANDGLGDKAEAWGYNAGQSVVWLLRPRFNALLETVFFSSESVVAAGKTARDRQMFLNPGIRWAYNFSNGLQIVPGISVPVGVGPSAGEAGVLFYLSFEHPFTRRKP